jgi:hypothetical protein
MSMKRIVGGGSRPKCRPSCLATASSIPDIHVPFGGGRIAKWNRVLAVITWSRRQIVLAAVTFATAASSGAQSLDQGFLPLAGVKIAVANQTEIDQVLVALREFGKLERLDISEGEIPKQGRDVGQIKLEHDQQTFFFMSNFRDVKSFQLTAYSHVSKSVWRPIWNRMIEKLTATVGSQRISAVEYSR